MGSFAYPGSHPFSDSLNNLRKFVFGKYGVPHFLPVYHSLVLRLALPLQINA